MLSSAFSQVNNILVSSSMKIPLMAFKAARLTNPTMIRNLNPDVLMVDLLKSFPFVTADEITNLKAELPAYLAKVEDLDDTIDKLSWWKTVCQLGVL